MRRPAQHHAPAAPAWDHPYRTGLFSPVWYASGDPVDPPNDTPDPADPPKPGPPAQRTFTQAEVESLAAKEKAQGKRSAAKEFAEKHGFGSIDDAEAFIAAARKAQDDALSEQEKRARELTEGKRRLDEERATLAAERAATRREKALSRLGAIGEDLDDAAVILERALRDQPDADEETIAAEAAKLRERRPGLFGVTPSVPPAGTAMPPAPGGAPAGGPPVRQAPTGKPGDRGREMARIRGHKPASAA
ncbi:hypothetical protein [Streptomyces scopuliridis]|uniref:hypothetical protein n=1 Tax=Streptomyces scopuliridis TaxID=452529 RepID=UPI00342DB349